MSTIRHLRFALLLALPIACRSRGPGVAGPLPECPPPLADTAGWRAYDAGEFTLLLPPRARRVHVQCIDTACGSVKVKTWSLDYEAGFLVGSTIDSAPPLLDLPDEHDCFVQASGHEWLLSVFDKGGGLVGGVARVLRWRGGRITLVMEGHSSADLAEFATAVRTIAIHRDR